VIERAVDPTTWLIVIGWHSTEASVRSLRRDGEHGSLDRPRSPTRRLRCRSGEARPPLLWTTSAATPPVLPPRPSSITSSSTWCGRYAISTDALAGPACLERVG
jgi:hypothetical protein